ncbi:cytokine receptor common subunit beta isoform 2-T3 [Clarias gariepinus]|uniref:cytokine receptor common subunit beta isoform X2 n=1 Tax=Clarias gariepinus TaxID=13013 RepID=UPI00234C3DD8|nr:cytokine receptor common subunit beta isoform X2 [Clarias gariepinus]
MTLSYCMTLFLGSSVMASLQCYNDFTTQIRCTWEEKQHTHLHMPIIEGIPCVPDGQPSGAFNQSCICKTDIFFMGNFTVFFNTSCPSKERTFNISAQGKLLPPTNFSEKKENGGGRLLSWSSPYHSSSRLSSNLTYQLMYRKHKDGWIVVDDINATQFVIESQTLLLGYSYEARVRARGAGGQWSDWSARVVWVTEEDDVINLQCVIREGGVTCSWQVKKWHAKFLSYQLCGHTNRMDVKCVICNSYSDDPHSGTSLVDFTCSLDSPEPELLTVDIRTLRKSKGFRYPDNIQPPRPLNLKTQYKDGGWKLSWDRPNVNEKLRLSYEVSLESNVTEYKVEFEVSEADLSCNVPPKLSPSTVYKARVRAVPAIDFSGLPSEWSEPQFFKTAPESWHRTIIYILITAFVAMLFIILYNALPACHRRVVLWNVSIPSPINSKVLGEMSNKKFMVGEANPYTATERSSVFIIQSSDNPIICKGSISEYPILACNDDLGMSFGKSESGWQLGSSHSSLLAESSRMTDKSGISFIGPYILCREDSSAPTETSDTCSSLLTFDDDPRYISENPKDPFPIKGGYVLSPPKNPTSECSTAIKNLASENKDASKSELPNDDPPAYTPSPGAVSNVIFSHPSGYCLMPNKEVVKAWMSAPPPEGDKEIKLHEIDRDLPERSYVTLSQRGL